MVLGPCFSKKPCALTTFAGLKKRDFGPVEERRPDLLAEPVARPGRPGRPPCTTHSMTRGSGGSRLPPVLEERKPAMNSSESPGRKKPTKRPDSAKTMAVRRSRPPCSSSFSGFSSPAARSAGEHEGRRLPPAWRPAAGRRAGPGPARPRARSGSPRLWSLRRSWWRGTLAGTRLRPGPAPCAWRRRWRRSARPATRRRW